MKLLLIDDDTIDRMRTMKALKKSEYSVTVVEATSAEEGLHLARNNHFDMILLDYQLPTMDGLELLKRLRKSTTNRAAVAMLSHREDESLALKCLEAGAQDFLAKSEVTTSRLIRAIVHAKERFRIEKQLLESHEKLRQLAEVDTLTGLANRYMFEQGLKNALPLAKRLRKSVALLMLDLDKFKNINDTLGHDAGDVLLKKVAKRLQGPVRNGDLLCRLGGDEFAILVQNLDEIMLIQKIANRFLHTLNNPFHINGSEITISASIGIATCPQCATDPIQLMKCADVAMYRSKEAGRNQSHFYSKSLHKRINNRFELENELFRALERAEFRLHYQPQIHPQTQQILGVEALIRWQNPKRGLILPTEFIPTLEENGLISQVGLWVLETACLQFHQWRTKFAKAQTLTMAINLSANQLGQGDLFEKIENTLAQYQIPPQYLELELTESAMASSAQATSLLLRFSQLGIKLVMDDFGTGYSSLFQLQKYPFQVLKIDKSFFQSISEGDGEALFLKAINAFAKVLGIQVVAEGVETETQREWCQKLSFDRVQGYFLAEPMAAKEFEAKWLVPSGDEPHGSGLEKMIPCGVTSDSEKP